MFTDLSDGIGIGTQKDQGYIGEGVISEESATKEFTKGAGEMSREVLRRHHLAVFNDTLQPTWFGHTGEISRLDYILGPLAWKDACTQAAPIYRLGRRLQAIPDRELRDQWSLSYYLIVRQLAVAREEFVREKWDRGARL
eukprot:2682370-Pyramimonas_sp.AAC.1